MGNKLSKSDSQAIVNLTNQLQNSKKYYQNLLNDKVQLWIESTTVSTYCCCKTEQDLLYQQNKIDQQLSKKAFLTSHKNNQSIYLIQIQGEKLVGSWHQIQYVQYWGNMFYTKNKKQKQQFRDSLNLEKEGFNQTHTQNWHSKIELFTPQFNISIIFISESQHKKIFSIIQTMKKYFTSFYSTDKFNSIAYKNFEIFNKNENNTMQAPQIQLLKTKMNISNEDFAKLQRLKQYKKTGLLTISQYIQFIHLLQSRKQLFFLFQKYCSNFKKLKKDSNDLIQLQKIMSQTQFSNFLKSQQLQKLQLNQELVKRIAYLNMGKTKQQQRLYSFSQFCMYLYTLKLNSAIITQNLNQNHALPNYFVNSSHNTYLTGNQLTSFSSANVYYQNLKNGLRCLQLDIHNGKSGPIIKHGFTLTQEVLFQNVMKAIKKFNYQNPFHTPIILSFQNHCNQQNSNKMAQILSSIFQEDVFYKIPNKGNNSQLYPKLKQLQGKIIIQGTGNFSLFYPHILKKNKNIKQQKNSQIILNVFNTMEDLKLKNRLMHLEMNNKQKSKVQNFLSKIQNLNQKKKTSESMLIQFNEEVKAKTISSKNQLVKFYGLIVSPLNLDNSCWQMANIAQNNLVKSYKRQKQPTPQTIFNYSRFSMIRIYPFGMRFNSSNYNPIPMLQCGCQLTSFNTQKIDIYFVVMQGIFQRYKNIGYSLKPDSIQLKYQSQSLITLKKGQIFEFCFLGCNNLYPRSSQFKDYDTLLEISFLGTQKDMKKNKKYVNLQKEQQDIQNQKIKLTQNFKCRQFYLSFENKYIKNSETLQFKQFPGVKLCVNDEIFANLYINIPYCGSISLPFKDLKTGYRAISLICFELGKRRQVGTLLLYIKKHNL